MSAAETIASPGLLKKRQRHSRWFVLLFAPLLVFTIGMAQEDGWQDETMEWTGYFLIILCVLGRSYASVFIGGIKNETVVRQGPFSIVRNPLYVFSFIGTVGVGLQSGRLSIALLLALVFMLYYRFVVAREEAFLLNKFGEPYQNYLREVPRWIPNFSLWSEPAEVVVRPQFVRGTMRDACVFFLAWPLLEVLEKAQHFLPTLSLP
jgi:protein-S-isoprenylcysteine O-methyltransferase Ste14